MALRINIVDLYGKQHDQLYKTLNKTIKHYFIGKWIYKCRLDVDIKDVDDIYKLREILDFLELSMKSK